MTEFTHLNDIVVQGSVSSSEQGSMIGSVKTMPPASDLNKDRIVLYSGETNGTYTKGMYYVSNGSKWTLSDAPLYSTNDYTSSDKAKLEGIADGAQVNKIETIKVNGATQAVVDKAVNISVPTSYGFKLQVNTATGVISLLDKQSVVLSTINTTINRVIKSGYYDTSTGNLVLVTDDNTKIEIPVSDLVDTYAADGTYLALDERVFSLSESSKRAVDAVATKANDDAVVHKTDNETITGTKTFSNIPIVSAYGWNGIWFKSSKYDATAVEAGDSRPIDIRGYDKNNVYCGGISLFLTPSYSRLRLDVTDNVGDGNKNAGIQIVADNTNKDAYATAPSWSVGTADNSDKILTTKMANSLPSIVHTTGNENIAGNKVFSGNTTVEKYQPKFIAKSTVLEKGVTGNEYEMLMFSASDKNGDTLANFYTQIKSDLATDSGITAINRKSDGANVYSTIRAIAYSNGNTVATAPATTDTAPTNAIVTKGYLQNSLNQAAFSKQPYVVAYDPAVAITNATTCITYQGRCASYVKPVMSNNVLDRGSWTDDEPLLKRIQYCTFRADGTIKEVLYKNDLTKVWIKNFADDIPDTPIYTNDELMQYCATLIQSTEVPADAADSSITTLDTMVVIPTLYTYGDGNGFKLSFDPSQGEAEAHTIDGEVCKYIAIGVYLGSVNGDGNLMSVSQAEPVRSTSRYNFRAKLLNKDESHGKWRLLNYWDSRLLKMLTVLIGGSMNAQATFGNGMISSMGIDSSGLTDTWTRNYATYTGKTDKVGMFGQSAEFTQKFDVDAYGKYDNGNTTAVRQVKCLVEAPWGQCWQFTDDHCNEPSTGRLFAGKNSAKVIHPLDNNDGLYFTNQVASPTLIEHICTIIDPTDGLPGLLAEAKGVYSNVIHTESAAWGLPAVKAGSSSTGSCDGWWMLPRSSAGVKNGIVGGGSGNGSGCGPFTWNGGSALSWAHVSIGARPVFVFN